MGSARNEASIAELGPGPTEEMVQGMLDAYVRGELAMALHLAEAILRTDPQHPVALAHAEECRSALERECLEVLGGGAGIPKMAVGGPLQSAVLREPRAEFLFRLIEADFTVSEIMDACGSKSFEALRLLRELVDKRIVRMR
jgi:hypothetical protein